MEGASGGRDRGLKPELRGLISELTAAGEPFVLATVVRVEPPTSARPGDKAVITVDGRLRGWVGGSCSEPVVRREALRALAQGSPRILRVRPADTAEEIDRPGELTLTTTCPGGGTLEIFVEPVLPAPLLVVFGSSPAARALVQYGSVAGFRTCAVTRDAGADLDGADLTLRGLDLGPARPARDAWAVVATMGHYDEDALAAALAQPSLDVTLIASRRRLAAVLANLQARGIDRAALERVRSSDDRVPGASQEEIALMVLASIVRRRRSQGPLALMVAPAVSSRFVTDPVCGMAVDTAAAPGVEHQGRTFHFCCTGCRDRFLAGPAEFASVP